MTPNDIQKEPEKIDYLKLNIHRIIQKEVADNITYIDRLAEESLMRGLSYAEEELTSYIRSLLASQVAELRERVQELGHQQEDDTIWCDMDAVLTLLDSYKQE